jgi:nucleotide-binding universal stress UspA family protein
MAAGLVVGYDGGAGAQSALAEAIALAQAKDYLAAVREIGEKATGEAVEKAKEAAVVGSHGERPIAGALLGSTPHKLLHISHKPVLVARAPGS